MKLGRMIIFAGVGWLAGALLALTLSMGITPFITGRRPSFADPVDRLILGMVLLGISPFTLLGGIAGGRISREGGERSQIIMAALLGVLLAFPSTCFALWYLGW